MANEPVNPVNLTGAQFKAQSAEAAKNAANLEAIQIATEEDLAEACDYNAFNPLAIARRFDTIERRIARNPREEAKPKDELEVPRIESIEEITEDFQNKNPELIVSNLTSLRSRLKDSDTADDILKLVQDAYPDHYLADEALNFLIRTTNPKSTLGKNLALARQKLNDSFTREINAGRNISEESRSFSEQGLGTPTSLRDLYKDVTGNPREPATLFLELSDKYDFQKLATVIKFLLHSLNADMKSKGPSISRPELQILFNETRTLQAILGIYRFFYSRMRLINSEFERNSIAFPQKLDFEILSKQFVKLIAERYPSVDKILKIGMLLGIGDDLLAQIIIYTQFRDGLRQVSPRLFKSEKQRQDLLLTLLDALSDLEDELDEEEEKEEEDEE